MAPFWTSTLEICADLQGTVLAKEEWFLQVGEVGDLERRRDYSQVSQALTAKEDSTWSFGVYLTIAYPASSLELWPRGPGLQWPGPEPQGKSFKSVVAKVSSVSAWLENQRLELGRTIESKHPSLPPGFIDGEADSNIHLTYLLGNYLARTVRHRTYISEPNRQKFLKL